MKRTLASILLLAMTAVSAQTPIRVTVSGEVGHPGDVVFDGKPRLDDVVKAAQVNRDAYVLGAAWLRPSLRTRQSRLKTGLTYELGLIDDKAMAAGHERLATLARRTRDWISAMPVTGRQVVRTLEPHELQVSLPDNFLVNAGDRLTYPSRPHSVTVVGAVEQVCDVPHAGLQDARDYLAQCASSAYADPDTLYVIEPDGNVFTQGIALWNRSPAMPVAPGAILYVPFAHKATHAAADEAFNRDMADFIATQPLGGTESQP